MTDMTAIAFITSVYADASTREKPLPITEEEAAVNMAEWKKDGVEYPEWLTPGAFAAVWNIYCMTN